MNARQKAKKLKQELERYKSVTMQTNVHIFEVPVKHYGASYMVANRTLQSESLPSMFGGHIRATLASEIMEKLKDELIINQHDMPEIDAQQFTTDVWIATYKGNYYEN